MLFNQSLSKCHRSQASLHFSSSQLSKMIRENSVLKLMQIPGMKELEPVVFRIYSRCCLVKTLPFLCLGNVLD